MDISPISVQRLELDEGLHLDLTTGKTRLSPAQIELFVNVVRTTYAAMTGSATNSNSNSSPDPVIESTVRYALPIAERRGPAGSSARSREMFQKKIDAEGIEGHLETLRAALGDREALQGLVEFDPPNFDAVQDPSILGRLQNEKIPLEIMLKHQLSSKFVVLNFIPKTGGHAEHKRAFTDFFTRMGLESTIRKGSLRGIYLPVYEILGDSGLRSGIHRDQVDAIAASIVSAISAISAPTSRELLRAVAQAIPDWLARYTAGDPFPRSQFMGSRTIYYGGAGEDGSPLRVFGGAHAAACFVFSDYGLSAERVFQQLMDETNPGHPKGYRPISVRSVAESEITPAGWVAHLPPHTNAMAITRPPEGPYAIFAVLERLVGYDGNHGPARLALLVIGGEAVASYDALYCQEATPTPPPFAVVIQDHGYGGNSWPSFGGESALWTLAKRHPPQYLLVGKNTVPWPGYQKVSAPERGSGQLRFLYQRT